VIAGLGRKRPTSANPNWATDCASTRSASALLAPWLRTTATNRGTILLCFSARTTAGKKRCNNLVNQRLIKFCAKCAIGNVHVTASLHLQLHDAFLFFTAG
jgi:hypothetical protein